MNNTNTNTNIAYTPSVAHLKQSDQDLIKRALITYYEITLSAYQKDPRHYRDLDDQIEPTEIELTIIEIAAMYGALTGEDIPMKGEAPRQHDSST